MKTTCLIALVLLSFLPGCVGMKSADEVAQLPGAAITQDALDFLMRLKEEGKLPGMEKDGHGKMQGNIKSLTASPYPYTGTFQSKKDGDATLYYYTVSKQTQTSPWQLQRAWQTDPQNKIVKEFPIE